MEGQEAGSVGQVEEGHGEGGGGQQVEDRHPLVWLLAINWDAGKKATALALEMYHVLSFTIIGNVYSDKLVLVYGIKFKHN